MESVPLTIHGRGAQIDPPNRYESFRVDVDPDPQIDPAELPSPKTVFLKDTSKTIIASNDSPDVGFTHSVNPYRGCEHGCSYCFARNGHNYLGMSAGLDFETKIMVKLDAPKLLKQELSRPKYVPDVIQISGVTDCYQPAERKLKLTRGCLEVLADCRHPVTMITKNHLITRDIDVLSELARWNCIVATLSVTTLDADLGGRMEPRASSPRRRLEAIHKLSAAGIPVGVMVAPVIPGLTDHEVPSILKAAADHGAQWAGFVPLRLALDVRVIFEDWLTHQFPDRAQKILNKLKSMHGGKVYESKWGDRMRGHGPIAEQISDLFHVAARRAGLDRPFPSLTTSHFRPPSQPQGSLFDGR
jgi:DNA repair photolyase